MDSTPAQASLTLDGTLGETFNYFTAFPEDPKILKGLVGVIWVLELGQTITCWHAIYQVSVTFYGLQEHILRPPLSLIFAILFHAFIAIGVQTFFVYRVWVLSRKWHIPILCCGLNLVRLASNLLLFAKMTNDRLYTDLTSKLKWEVILTGTISPVVDIIIAAALIYYLRDIGNTPFKHTGQIVKTIMVWTLERTLLTTATGVLQVVLYIARHNDLSWLMLFLIQGKLFSNSLLASLNGRVRFRSSHPPPVRSTVMDFNSMRGPTSTSHPDTSFSLQRISESRDSQDIFALTKGIESEAQTSLQTGSNSEP
ncbi:Saposin B-type domain-containing protein [Mycena sanguinolenta]|uniref:Saposin B-type domain-containing protein n=1 Tax=Mycena sanguinolenta TaxID=230812 RepID=A0A8H6Z3G4_9AGAR|nr:Saposin B-type domain-containing protein [Mycena sanguinolenta]